MSRFTGLMGNGGFEIDNWLREVRKQIEHYGPSVFPDERACIRFAVEWLSGAAQDWWENCNHSAISSWADFERTIRERYRPQMPEEMARQRLRHLVQRGRVETYINEFLKLVARIPGRSEEDKIFDFKVGLDVALGAKVAAHKPKTLQEAMEVAVQQEPYVTMGARKSAFRTSAGPSYYGDRRAAVSAAPVTQASGAAPMDLNAVEVEDEPQGQDERTAPTANAASAVLQKMLEKMEALEARINTLGTRSVNGADTSARVPGMKAGEISRLQAEGRCFRCKEKGHMKRDCPKSRAQPRLNF